MGNREHSWAAILEVIRDARVIRNPERLQRSLSFSEQGIDSLDQAALLLAIEEAFGIPLLADPRKRPARFDDILDLLAVEEKKP